MARPINPDARGDKYWNYVIVLMGRLRSAMLIDTRTDESLAKETIRIADLLIALAQRHKAGGRESKPTQSERKRPTTG